MLKSLIGYAEKGLLPDSLIRVGIRKLCRVRLNWVKEIGPEALENHHQEWVEKLKNSPIISERDLNGVNFSEASLF